MNCWCWILGSVSLLLSKVEMSGGCEDAGTVQLKDGSSPREGRVEICMDRVWGTICEFSWDDADAAVVCRQLGYSDRGAQAFGDGEFPMGTGVVHGGRYNCVGTETRLVHCEQEEKQCQQNDNAAVRCQPANCSSGSVRLREGAISSSGRVEICIEGQWGTVCDNNWGVADSAVVCRQLGLPSQDSIPISFGSFGQTDIDNIHISDLNCVGTEEGLLSCQHTEQHSCSHSEDAGVICQSLCENGEVRMVDPQGLPSSRGRVEVCLDTTWNVVCDQSWTEQDATVVCRQLGYSQATALDTAELQPYAGPRPTGSILFKNVNCTGDETKLVHCQTINQLESPLRPQICTHRTSVGVGCAQQAGPGNMDNRIPDSSTTGSTGTTTDSALPWAIAATTTALLLGLIIINILCFVVVYVKKHKLPMPTELRNNNSSTQNSTYDYIRGESIAEESSPTYGGNLVATERPFHLETNPSYKQVPAVERTVNPEYSNLTSSYTADGYVNC